MFNAYLTGVGKRDTPLCAFANSLKAQVHDTSTSFRGGTSVLWGFGDDTERRLIFCRENNLPFFHLDHAYFKRGYEHGNFRVNWGHFHQTRLFDRPPDRSQKGRKRLREWSKGNHIVIVVPSERIAYVLGTTAKDWVRSVEIELKKHTDRPLVVKQKGGSIHDVLINAHACVSLSSVAEVESVVFGVPVFVTPDSPAYPVGLTDLSLIESPIYPDRDGWINTLSYSQFHLDEFRSGKARDILRDMYGIEHLFGPENGLNHEAGCVDLRPLQRECQ